jgi:hypothetical protein
MLSNPSTPPVRTCGVPFLSNEMIQFLPGKSGFNVMILDE